MKSTLIRTSFFLILAIIQGSLLNLLVPSLSPYPVILLSYALSTTMERGYHRALPLILACGAILDIMVSDRPGIGMAYAAGVAYTASFFSKRFTLEHRAFSIAAAFVLVAIASFFYPLFAGVVSSLWVGNPGIPVHALDISLASSIAIASAIAVPGVAVLSHRLEERIRLLSGGNAQYI